MLFEFEFILFCSRTLGSAGKVHVSTGNVFAVRQGVGSTGKIR